jgi:hypothetical protein
VEGKNGQESLIQSKRLRGIEWWTLKICIVHNFDKQLTEMLPLGVQTKMSKLMLKEILGECTYVWVCVCVCARARAGARLFIITRCKPKYK